MMRVTTLLVAVAILGAAAGHGTAAEADARKLLGTWTHQVKDSEVTIVVEPDTLHCTIAFEEGFTFSLSADYVVTADGVLLGILRSKGCPTKPVGHVCNVPGGSTLQTCPTILSASSKGGEKDEAEKRIFLCRFKVEDGTLVLSDVNCHNGIKARVQELIQGKYQKAESAKVNHLSQSRKERSSTKQGNSTSPDLGCAVQALVDVLGDWCPLNLYSSNPNRRTAELINTAEDLSWIEYEWERLWFTDQPSHLTPERVHGGVSAGSAPASSSSVCTPIPVLPWVNEGKEDKYRGEADYRTPTVPPIREGTPKPWEDPPDEAEVLRVLSRTPCGFPIWGHRRDDIQIVSELLVNRVDPPRFYPFVGPAQLHHCHWKCTIYYTETIESNFFRYKQPRIEVVYLDKDHLHLCSENNKPSQPSPDSAAEEFTDPDASRRIRDLINESFIREPIEARGWFERWLLSILSAECDRNHLTPERVHGGIQ